LTYLSESLGFRIKELKKGFGEQYYQLFLEKEKNCSYQAIDFNFNELIKFSEAEKEFRQKWQNFFKKHSGYIWGAGAKGVSFCNMIDPEAKSLRGIIDINPNKQGKFCPVTGHPIISPAEIEADTEYILVMNNNYLNEIKNLMSTKSKADILTI
jgi:hypothetical protein